VTTYLGIGDPMIATTIDEALALRLLAAEHGGRAPVGTADVDPAELEDPGPVDEPHATADDTGYDPLARAV